MLSWLGNIFNARAPKVQPIEPGDPVPPGLTVSIPGTAARGTVSAFVDGPNGTQARVIVVEPETTWIQNVSLYRLEL